MKKYQIIYADPPWKYGSKSAVNNTTGNDIKKLSEHYESMSTREICELPIKDITEKDACCFSWFTSSHGEDAYKVMRAWGFKPIKIGFVWEKITKNGTTCQNVGPWTMGNYEYVLFGTKGSMTKYKKQNNIPEKIAAERTQHSKKPDEVRNRIIQLFGDLPRIELFARQRTEGWDVFGNEVESDIELTTIKPD
jgi:N6-adenosine-specific RNA methylase IME4